MPRCDVTEKHYNPWVWDRPIQLEADVTAAWQNDPLAQMQRLRNGLHKAEPGTPTTGGLMN